MSWLMAERRGAAVAFIPGTMSPYVGVGHIPVGWVLERVVVRALYDGVAANDRVGLGLVGVGEADVGAWEASTRLYVGKNASALAGESTMPYRVSGIPEPSLVLEPYVRAVSGPMMVILAAEANSVGYEWLLRIVFGRPLDVEGMIRAGFDRVESSLRGT